MVTLSLDGRYVTGAQKDGNVYIARDLIIREVLSVIVEPLQAEHSRLEG